MGYQVEYIRLLSKFVKKANGVTVSFDEQAFEQPLLNVYPNPSNETITLSGAKGIINLFDLKGQLITQYESGNNIAIDYLAKGVYIFENQGIQVKFIKN